MKTIILKLITVIGRVYGIIPTVFSHAFLFGWILLESRASTPEKSLKRLFSLHDKLTLVINETAMRFGNGSHPKHELTNYHQFFINHIPEGAHVLDIGCGEGQVANSLAQYSGAALVTGIDISEKKIRIAQSTYQHPKLTFMQGDALKTLPSGKFDVVILSNVLEHIDQRVNFLISIMERISPQLILIRVPAFERDWQVSLRKKLGIYYFSDKTHYIEHTNQEFHEEVAASGLHIQHKQNIWGEIWAIAYPS
ncbi:MAG: hypothetical protein Tsb005_05100 [Gammaproteobacteria bacterium]